MNDTAKALYRHNNSGLLYYTIVTSDRLNIPKQTQMNVDGTEWYRDVFVDTDIQEAINDLYHKFKNVVVSHQKEYRDFVSVDYEHELDEAAYKLTIEQFNRGLANGNVVVLNSSVKENVVILTLFLSK